jgi:hypothetical protein
MAHASDLEVDLKKLALSKHAAEFSVRLSRCTDGARYIRVVVETASGAVVKSLENWSRCAEATSRPRVQSDTGRQFGTSRSLSVSAGAHTLCNGSGVHSPARPT